jgi:hypothetical protein
MLSDLLRSCILKLMSAEVLLPHGDMEIVAYVLEGHQDATFLVGRQGRSGIMGFAAPARRRND